MGKLRYAFALFMAKVSIIALKVTGHNGTDFPGRLAIKICPDFLVRIKKPAKIIGVTGTNGKTTTTNLVNDALTSLGLKTLSNTMGSNISSGLATIFIRGVTLFGREKCDIAVLEIDERSASVLFKQFTPDEMIILNLSRDSIMRNAHPRYMNWVLSSYLPVSTKLVLNADDLLSADVAPSNDRIYFGIEPMPGDKAASKDKINDMKLCPECNAPLKYDYVRYSSIGKAHCERCGFKSPDYDYAGSDVDKISMTMHFKEHGEYVTDAYGNKMVFPLIHDGTFNIYNQVAVMSLLRDLGYSYFDIKKAFSSMHVSKDRISYREVHGIKIYSLLCKDKNAYACSRVFEYLDGIEGDKEVIVLVNSMSAERAWSENICWLYDADFELLAKDSVKRVIVEGKRGIDYKMRLLTAGIPEDRICYQPVFMDTYKELLLNENESIFLLFGTEVIPETHRLEDLIEQAINAKYEGTEIKMEGCKDE